jgi:RNA polymerase sigma-70 factor (ECF subfamily)
VAADIDTDLLAACRRGDRDAFRALFELYKDRVYSIAIHYSGDRDVAMDIAQDVFVKLFSRIAGFRGDSRFDSWLYRLTANVCFDRRRRERRLVRIPDIALLDQTIHQPAPCESAAALRQAVARLMPDLRMAVILRYTEGLSYDEMAEVLGCPAGTVASRLNRAHKELARMLGGKGDRHE